MLRDKLHLLSAQVVEARERVTELEAIREGKIERVGGCRQLLIFRPNLIVPSQKPK